MKLDHAVKINIAEDVDIMQNERLVQIARIFEKEPCCLFEAAARVEQDFFARDFKSHAKVCLLLQVIDNHVGEVMYVDDHLADSKLAQPAQRDLQERLSSHLHQGFRMIVSQRTKARAEASCQNHGLHCPARPSFARSGS